MRIKKHKVPNDRIKFSIPLTNVKLVVSHEDLLLQIDVYNRHIYYFHRKRKKHVYHIHKRAYMVNRAYYFATFRELFSLMMFDTLFNLVYINI